MSTGWGRVAQATNRRVHHWREWHPFPQPPLSADGCQQSFREGLDLRSTSLSHDEVQMDPALFRSCPGRQSCSESMGTVALPYPEGTSVQHTSLTSSSYILFTPFMVPEPWRGSPRWLTWSWAFRHPSPPPQKSGNCDFKTTASLFLRVIDFFQRPHNLAEYISTT